MKGLGWRVTRLYQQGGFVNQRLRLVICSLFAASQQSASVFRRRAVAAPGGFSTAAARPGCGAPPAGLFERAAFQPQPAGDLEVVGRHAQALGVQCGVARNIGARTLEGLEVVALHALHDALGAAGIQPSTTAASTSRDAVFRFSGVGSGSKDDKGLQLLDGGCVDAQPGQLNQLVGRQRCAGIAGCASAAAGCHAACRPVAIRSAVSGADRGRLAQPFQCRQFRLDDLPIAADQVAQVVARLGVANEAGQKASGAAFGRCCCWSWARRPDSRGFLQRRCPGLAQVVGAGACAHPRAGSAGRSRACR